MNHRMLESSKRQYVAGHALIATTLIVLAGCSAVPAGSNGEAAVDLEIPTYADLAAAHNQRVSQLSRVSSDGVVEIVWRDEDGVRRFRQGDINLYLDLPRRTALRVYKLGDTYMWLGSDEERYWLFDLVDDRVLYTGLHEELESAADTGLLTVHPLALLDLIGLGPLMDCSSKHGPTVEFDHLQDAWVVESRGGGGPVRIAIDRATRLPVRIETLDRYGDVVYSSRINMARYRSVSVPGVSAAAQPRMVGQVDITSGPAAPSQGEVKLVFDSPTGRVDDRTFERVFDLERLKGSLRPQRIEEFGTSQIDSVTHLDRANLPATDLN